jgi:hypothetical protein
MKKLDVTGIIVPRLNAAKPFAMAAMACSLMP